MDTVLPKASAEFPVTGISRLSAAAGLNQQQIKKEITAPDTPKNLFFIRSSPI
jgi:hypothetical protein